MCCDFFKLVIFFRTATVFAGRVRYQSSYATEYSYTSAPCYAFVACCTMNYRGADKSLARPGRKQATATKL